MNSMFAEKHSASIFYKPLPVVQMYMLRACCACAVLKGEGMLLLLVSEGELS